MEPVWVSLFHQRVGEGDSDAGECHSKPSRKYAYLSDSFGAFDMETQCSSSRYSATLERIVVKRYTQA